VLMRHFAKAAATALNANGYLQLDTTTADSLQCINVSPFPVVASAHYGPYRARAPARDWASRRFHFAFDMDRYWAEPLGNVFGVATSDIEDLAEEIVCDDWGMRSYHGWKQDARRAAGVLRDDYTSAMRKVEQAELAENLESARQGAQVSILDNAAAPSSPKRPRWMIALGGVAGSIGFAVAVAALLELIDPVVIGASQVAKLSNKPILGTVPLVN